MNPANIPEIFFEDEHIIVCKKPAGTATQTKNSRALDMESLLKRHIYQNMSIKKEPYLAIIHRLDQPVSGILVFAKTPLAAKNLNLQLQKQGFGKHYKALLTKCPPANEASNLLIHYMKKDGRTNTSSICRKDDPSGKEARLHYEIINHPTDTDWALFDHCKIEDISTLTPVHVTLDTGRHHQIRVQMAHLGCPIWGDAKYGTVSHDWKQIALCAYKLEFKHPITNKKMLYTL